MRVALVVSAHGFGHLTRQCALAEELLRRRAEVSVYTAGPADFLPRDTRHVSWTVDVGIVQRDSVTEDLRSTLPRVEERCADTRVDALAGELSQYDLVISDTSAVAIEAARRAGVRAVAVGNFDWAWIYAHYPELSAWSRRFAAWQAAAAAIELWPGPGLHDFARVRRVGVMGRRSRAVRVAGRTCLVSFGGFGLDRLGALLPEVPGLTWVFAAPMRAPARPDCLQVDDVPFPALVAGADCVLTKPGYGIYAEAALAGTPLVWLDRPAFPEAPAMERAMRARGDRKVPALDADVIAAEVCARLGERRPTPVPDATQTVADALRSG